MLPENVCAPTAPASNASPIVTSVSDGGTVRHGAQTVVPTAHAVDAAPAPGFSETSVTLKATGVVAQLGIPPAG